MLRPLVVALASVTCASGATAAASPPLLVRGTVITMDGHRRVLPHGSVLVRRGRIAAIWRGQRIPRGVSVRGAKIVDAGPGGVVLPGLLDIHDHPGFDVLGSWPPPAREAPYSIRYDWNDPGPDEYRRLVANVGFAIRSTFGRLGEAEKYAEARETLNGVTSLQGARGSDPSVGLVMARNVDGVNFGSDRVDSWVPAIATLPEPDAAALRSRMQSGAIRAWFVHLAEGAPGDEAARGEFATLKSLGLLGRSTVIIHGTALEPADFAEAAEAHAKLVWSPLSNLELYGATTDVYAAIAAGLPVSLSTDWTPSGSNGLLMELKVAELALRDPRILGSRRGLVPRVRSEAALDRLLVEMVTRNPAFALGWQRRVGSLERGKVADVLVLRRPPGSPTIGSATPYRSVLDATPRDVRLVLVGGTAIAGDLGVMRAVKGSDFESVASESGGYVKGLDTTAPGAPTSDQRLSDIERAVDEVLAALGEGPTFGQVKASADGGLWRSRSDVDFRSEYLVPHFGEVDGRINLEAVRRAPLFPEDDRFLLAYLAGRPVTDPPFAPYPFARFFEGPMGNAFAPDRFEDRWFRASAQR